MFHVVFEGPDGSGKTTQAQLYAKKMRKLGWKVIELHQPGSTAVGQALRKVAKGEYGVPVKQAQFYITVAEHCEFLEYLCMLYKKYKKNKKVCIVQDRHSAVSGWVYQVCGNNTDRDEWLSIYSRLSTQYADVTPNCIFIMLPQSFDTIIRRMKSRRTKRDHYEQTNFLKLVYAGYSSYNELENVIPSRIVTYRFHDSASIASIESDLWTEIEYCRELL